jgi:hypothetical protein
MTYILIYFAVFIVWMVIEMIIAPTGYQENNKFYYGKKEKNNVKYKLAAERYCKFYFRELRVNKELEEENRLLKKAR